jgi:4,5-DOPA dioxygenase extradiol
MAFPALFVSHGAPSAALEDDACTRALGAWARERPRPRAVVVVSAHAEAHGPVRVNAAAP